MNAALLVLLPLCLPVPDLLDETRGVVAGSPDSAVQVTHLRLAGTQRAIGRRLAEIARDEHGCEPTRSTAPTVTLAQTRYFERYFPQHIERMHGAAQAFGGQLEDTSRNFSRLSFGFGRPGCTVAFYPGDLCADGVGVVSRNFDFTTGTWRGRLPQDDSDERVCGRPYVLELHPSDGGYASIAICAYDLLGGVVDGMNSEGLVVALLADDEIKGKYGLSGAPGPRPGFNVVQVGRYLLETCATAEEARAALIEAKLYYQEIPCHYLIADAGGDSFVWENDVTMTHGYVIEREEGEPLVTTNFMHHLHGDGELPQEANPAGMFNRHRTVCRGVTEREGPLTLDAIRESARAVAQVGPAPPAPRAPGRTLWHTLYRPAEGTLEVDFYLGEEPEGGIRRSGYLEFGL